MENNIDSITLIVPTRYTEADHRGDRGGGETQSLKDTAQRMFGTEQQIDLKIAKAKLEDCMKQVNALLEDIAPKAIKDWELDGVSVSLAISAQGSIGIATVGVEASIELSFARAPKTKEPDITKKRGSS